MNHIVWVQFSHPELAQKSLSSYVCVYIYSCRYSTILIITLFDGSDSRHLFDLPFSGQIALLLRSSSAKCIVLKDRL